MSCELVSCEPLSCERLSDHLVTYTAILTLRAECTTGSELSSLKSVLHINYSTLVEDFCLVSNKPAAFL